MNFDRDQDAVIEELINAAILAPSAMNLQPWAFALIRGAGRLQTLSNRIKPYLLEHLPAHSPLAAHIVDSHFEIFHGAPVLLIIVALEILLQTKTIANNRDASRYEKKRDFFEFISARGALEFIGYFYH